MDAEALGSEARLLLTASQEKESMGTRCPKIPAPANPPYLILGYPEQWTAPGGCWLWRRLQNPWQCPSSHGWAVSDPDGQMPWDLPNVDVEAMGLRPRPAQPQFCLYHLPELSHHEPSVDPGP